MHRSRSRGSPVFENRCDHGTRLAPVAVGYQYTSGLPVRVTAKEAADLAAQVSAGDVDARTLAAAVKEWTEYS
ncbi:hypothetical protein MBT84_37645 [Streptomyces sp. MBT84]|nr:hypothetical protein [Streptomyces sp. MBT84]